MQKKITHYVKRDGDKIVVAEAFDFITSGGLTSNWGRNWRPVTARSAHQAAEIGAEVLYAKVG